MPVRRNPGPYQDDIPYEGVTIPLPPIPLPPIVSATLPQGLAGRRGRAVQSSNRPLTGIAEILDRLRHSREGDPRGRRAPGLTGVVAPPGSRVSRGPSPLTTRPGGLAEAATTPRAAPPKPGRTSTATAPAPSTSPLEAPTTATGSGKALKGEPTAEEAGGIFGLSEGERRTLLDLGFSMMANPEDDFMRVIGESGLFTLQQKAAREKAAREAAIAERTIAAQEATVAANVAQTTAEIEDMPRKARIEAERLGLDKRKADAYEKQVEAQINQMNKNNLAQVLSTTSGAVAVMKDSSVTPLVDMEGKPLRVKDATEAKLFSDVFNATSLTGQTNDESAAAAIQALKSWRAQNKGGGAPQEWTITPAGPGKFTLTP